MDDTQTSDQQTQQQSGPPDWAKQLAQQMADKQQGAQQQQVQPAAQQQAKQPSTPDYGKADPDRLMKDAKFYASQPDSVWQLIKDTYEEQRGGIASSKVTEIERRQTELELRAVRAEAARDYGLTAEETQAFLTGGTPEQIAQQAKYLHDYKKQFKNETQSQDAQQSAQGATARESQQQQSANTPFRLDDKGNIIIVPGNYPDTRSPLDIAKAKLAEKMAKGENIYG